MNLWLRLLALLLSNLWRPRLSGPSDVSRLTFRVWPHDLDTSMHMNNGRYWTLMDLGRMDFVLRTGLWRAVVKNGWVPIVGAATIRFRREIRLWERFQLETRIVAWADTYMMIEHRMMKKDGTLAALAIVKGSLYDRKIRAFVPTTDILAATGHTVASSEMPPEALALLAADEALRTASNTER